MRLVSGKLLKPSLEVGPWRTSSSFHEPVSLQNHRSAQIFGLFGTQGAKVSEPTLLICAFILVISDWTKVSRLRPSIRKRSLQLGAAAPHR